jgi:uncharacterized protein YacL
MARRTKAEIAREKAVDAACNKACVGLQVPIFKMKDISEAAEKAYDAGDDCNAAARKKAEEVGQAA